MSDLPTDRTELILATTHATSIEAGAGARARARAGAVLLGPPAGAPRR